jgi:hypothetical protein
MNILSLMTVTPHHHTTHHTTDHDKHAKVRLDCLRFSLPSTGIPPFPQHAGGGIFREKFQSQRQKNSVTASFVIVTT